MQTNTVLNNENICIMQNTVTRNVILKNGITHIPSNNMLQNTIISIIVIQGHSNFTFMPSI